MTERSTFGTIPGAASRFNAGVACSDAPAAYAPDRAAIVAENDGEVDSLTFAELARRSNALAARLAPGENIGVYAPAGPTAATAHIAVMKAGSATVPLVPLLGDAAIAHRIADAGITTLLTAPELAGAAAGFAADIQILEHQDPDVGFTAAPTGPDDPSIVLYTSGTTGKPKGALEPHRLVLARHAPLAMIHGPFLPDDVFWTPADWMWVGSLVDAVLTPLAFGCTVFTYARRRFDPDGCVERLKEFGVTRAFIPPTALRQLTTTESAAWSGHKLRSVHSGGEKLTDEAAGWAADTLGLVVDEIYGMTEASFVVGNAHRYFPPVSGSMGRPFPNQTVRVADTNGQPAAPGDIGELEVIASSPSLFLGYHGNPEATAERFHDGWFATGDLVRADAAGHLFYLGRKDDLIMSSGHRIGPGEIEDVLRGHARVAEVVVVGAPDDERGQCVKAVVRLADDAPADGLTGELQDLVRARVGRHAYPRSVEYVTDFPRTVTGKVRRDLLRLAPDQREVTP